jgi:hypothetical protein
MPHPSEAHVDSALSTFISSYENGTYFADELIKVIEVDHVSDKVQQYSRKDVTTPTDDALGPNAEANEADYTISTTTYRCEDHGLVGYVSNSEIANADDPQRPFEKRSKHLMNQILLNREIRAATLLQTTANYASANTSGASNVWTDTTNGTPLADCDLMVSAIAPGMEEDDELVMILALEGWQALRKHPDIKGGGHISPVATLAEAAERIGVDRILVSKAQKNTANYGQAATYARIWDATKAVIVRVPKGEPTDEAGLFAATFRWVDPALGAPIAVRTWDAPKRGRGGSQAVQVELSDAEKVVQNDKGYCLTAITS